MNQVGIDVQNGSPLISNNVVYENAVVGVRLRGANGRRREPSVHQQP